MFDNYPLSRFPACSVVLPGLPEQASVLRSCLRDLKTLPKDLVDTAELLVTELFTNAIRHTRSGLPGGTVAVTIRDPLGHLQVLVTDGGPRENEVSTPHLRQLNDDREGSRGLMIVHQLATRWGTIQDSNHTTVWFELDTPTSPTPLA
ncbi:ATP-binding protein [Thermobifida fusca]|nr:ATP-binding protein [Thermobifida fusca]